MPPSIDPGLIESAEAAADLAGRVIRPLFRSAGLATVQKGDASPVTIADRDAEQAMRAMLRERFPDHGILGEEFGLERPYARWRWVLDPIDGTRAFITGRPQFGTLVSLLEDGLPVIGVIDQPVTGERWVGVTGLPTRFRSPLGGKAGCRACPDLGAAEMSVTSPEMFSPAERARWQKLRDRVGRVSFGGDCYAYGLVALGFIDVIAEPDLKVWDWAALVPVIEGAGGRMTNWEGQTLRVAADASEEQLGIAGPVLVAGDPTVHEAAVRLLAG